MRPSEIRSGLNGLMVLISQATQLCLELQETLLRSLMFGRRGV